MIKLLSLIAVLALVLSCTVMGIGTVASAAEESSPDDFIVFEGLLEEYVGNGDRKQSYGYGDVLSQCSRS